MNIVHVANNAAPQFGGAYRSIVLFRSAASTRNYSTQCISFDDEPHENPHLNDRETWHIIPTRRGVLGRKYALVSHRSVGRLTELVESADLIFVHLLYRYHAVWAAQCARQFSKPIVVVPHGSLDPYVFTYRAFTKRLWLKTYHDLLFRDSLVLYATDRERERAAATVGNVKAKSLYWPIDDETCHLADTLPRLPCTPRQLLFVGRLHPVKRVLETVRAFCRASVPGWQLVVIGAESGEISPENLQTAAGAEWNRSVVYRGVLDRQSLYSEYTRASALILASHHESFGHVVAEAMRFGLPVLVSEGVDLGAVVSAAGAGLVVPVGSESEDDILDGLARFLRSTPEELEKLGQSARSAAKEHFAFQTFADSFNTILETLVSQGAMQASGRDPQIV
jgi:glycosyltransferase involved in cell wall biosynthesis